ncbi:MAG: type II CAAX endopeptidase family protein [Candidatus Eremiobacterota bacterium]
MTEPPATLRPAGNPVLRMLLRIQAGLFLVALAWGWLRGIPWWGQVRLDGWLLLGLPAGVALSILSQSLFEWWGRRSPLVRSLREDLLRPISRCLTLRDKALVSACSGVAEEALFRGVLLGEFGLPVSSLLFGIFHVGDRRMLPLIAWAVVVGAGLAMLVQATGNLGAAMAVHAASNFTTFLILQRGPTR